MQQKFILNVNGSARELTCDPERKLIDVLREDLKLTGTKRGCDVGVCGTCTVLVDGKPKRSCVIKIKNLFGTRDSGLGTRNSNLGSRIPDPGSRIPEVVTIEGLEKDGKLHPIQQAFIDCGAIQCGFCTPGMVLTAKALLDENKNPTREEIKKALANILCRCTGYKQIFEAIEKAAKIITQGGS